jgi:excisionase family DNA binding protein
VKNTTKVLTIDNLPEGYLRPAEACTYLGIGKTTFYKLAGEGYINLYKVPGHRFSLIYIDELRDFKSRMMRGCATGGHTP